MKAVRAARRSLAMCCVALCLALLAQMSVALLDRLQHALDVDHAATVLAGRITHEHDYDHDHGFNYGHGHEHGEALPAHESPVGHHHQGDGMLAPWLASAIYVFAGACVAQAAYPAPQSARPDVAERRRERPPKTRLEHVA
jgi:hypothetical protein